MKRQNMITPSAKDKEWMKEKDRVKVDERMRIETRFGRHVQIYRKKRQLTQAELAALCNVHQNYISDIEAGKRNVTLRVLGIVAKALGVQVKDLVA